MGKKSNNQRTDRLNLTVDSNISDAAKVYAERAGLSVSMLVEGYLASVTGLSGPLPQEASQAEILELVNFSGNVMTADGGIFQATKAQQSVVAYLNTLLIISEDAVLAPEVFAVESAIRRAGYGISKKLIVKKEIIEMLYGIKLLQKFSRDEVIGKTYEADREHEYLQKDLKDIYQKNRDEAEENERKSTEEYERKSTTDKRAGKFTEIQIMQKEFIREIKTAYDFMADEIHFRVSRYEGHVFYKRHNEMFVIEITRSDFISDLLAAAFNLSDASGSYRPLEYQRARISDIRMPLPEGIGYLELNYTPLPNGGRYLFCRLIRDTAPYPHSFNDLIRSEKQRNNLISTLDKPGLHILYGKNSSGKTTLMSEFLKTLSPKLNIITVQDPPELIIPNAAQCPVLNAQTDFEKNEKFRQAIVGALMCKPDILMVSDICTIPILNLLMTAIEEGVLVYITLGLPSVNMVYSRLLSLEIKTHHLAKIASLTETTWLPSIDHGVADNRRITQSMIEKLNTIGYSLTETSKLSDNDDIENHDNDFCPYRGRVLISATSFPNYEIVNSKNIYICQEETNKAINEQISENLHSGVISAIDAVKYMRNV
jgi:type II secretory ATPase GspE/PulE/Tfp pilus assembly ATPase PilB-like protein